MPDQPSWGTVSGGSVRVNKLLTIGHSIPAGQNENALAGNRFPSTVAQLVGATETNVAVGGSALCTDNVANRASAFWTTSGGWITAMAANAPNRSAQTDFSGNVVSPLQAVILMHGYNDLGVIGPPGQNLANKAQGGGVFDTTFPPGLIATINRLRAGHLAYVWNGTDSGGALRGATVFDANWTKFTGTGITSTGFGAFPTAATVGATATITVPSWYQGGLPIDLLFVGSLNNQGTWTINCDGVAVGTCDGSQILATSEATTREQTPYSFRVPASALAAPGSHTIQVIFASGASSPYLDSWTIEASTPPLVVIPKMYKMQQDQSPAGNLPVTSAANYGVRNTDILALNKVLDGIAAGYTDGRVITVDTDSIINQNAALLQTGADQIHPSMTGAGLIARAVANAINGYYAAHPLDLALTGKG